MPAKITSKNKAKADREKRLAELMKESQYKTIKKNPEVFEGTTMVTDLIENDDGSATIQLEFTQEQKDMLWDVCLRQAIVNGLQHIDQKSEDYASVLNLKTEVIEQSRVVLECLTMWETDCDFDYSPVIANEVQKLRDLLSKL
jgi:hypothetical protein